MSGEVLHLLQSKACFFFLCQEFFICIYECVHVCECMYLWVCMCVYVHVCICVWSMCGCLRTFKKSVVVKIFGFFFKYRNFMGICFCFNPWCGILGSFRLSTATDYDLSPCSGRGMIWPAENSPLGILGTLDKF